MKNSSAKLYRKLSKLPWREKWTQTNPANRQVSLQHSRSGHGLIHRELMMNQAKPIKQVIVMRHDLKMRRGKQIAQGAHASMAFLTQRLRESEPCTLAGFSEVQRQWIEGSFAKICCRVNSESELLGIRDRAIEAGLLVHLITDSGKTEFHGVPTHTCLAVGPDFAENIDPITGDLQLL